jgi:hypothetical protein
MFFERKLVAVPPVLVTANGTANGLITVSSVRGFRVKQQVLIKATGGLIIPATVQKVISDTQIYLGPAKGPSYKSINDRIDLTSVFLSNTPTLEAAEQERINITFEDRQRAMYVEEPVVAQRSILVDDLGRYYGTANPVPVRLSDGSINIGTVNAELEVQLSHQDNDPNVGDIHDSVRIGNGIYEMTVNPDGSINTNNALPFGASLKSFYNEASSVANNIVTDVLTYTVPALTTSRLVRVDVSGSNIATYTVEKNGTVIDKKYTWFNGDLSQSFIFDGSETFVSGDVLKIRAIHTRPSFGDFNARITVQEQS